MYAGESCVLKHLLENMYAERKKQQAAEDGTKNKLLKGWKPMEDLVIPVEATPYSKLVWGGSICGKTNSLSYESLKPKCYLLPVDAEEAGIFAVEMGCCAEVHGEDVHTSHGMNSKPISPFHYRNSYNLINAF